MLEYFLRFIKANHLLEKQDNVLLAVSGGVDSMVLGHLFLEANIPFSVAHVNYQLRGEESDKDEAWVMEWCKKNEITCFHTRVPSHLFESSQSIQMVARDFRYAYFEKLLVENGYQKIATAHHLDDSLETTLLNLSKGTGLRGLTGISKKQGNTIRPLLFARKDEILNYARAEGLVWREDASNQKKDYQRNIIRNQVIPLLKEINPGLLGTFSRTLDHLEDHYQLILSQKRNIENEYLSRKGAVYQLGLGWMGQGEGNWTMLSELLRPFGFSYFQVDDIMICIQKRVSGKMFYSTEYELNLDRDQLVIQHKNEGLTQEYVLKIPGGTSVESSMIHTKLIDGNSLSEEADRTIAYFDRELIKGEVIVRRWRQGDYFQPLGMKGKKKLSDFMIDSKIPVTLKRDVLLLECDHTILWVVGWQIDDRFKVTKDTHRMLRIEIKSDV